MAHPSGSAFLCVQGRIRPHWAQVLRAPKENIFHVMCLETISHRQRPTEPSKATNLQNVSDTVEAKETFPVS